MKKELSPQSGPKSSDYADILGKEDQAGRHLSGQHGIIRLSALWDLCRCRHNGHWTKRADRLDRSYGASRFGNTAYAREELVAELTAVFLGQHLGFTAHTLEHHASYLESWMNVLKADKTAIFKHVADAQKACDFLIAASAKGRAAVPTPEPIAA